MTHKKCNNCFQIKPVEEFYPRRERGKIYRQARCKKCHPEVVRAYNRAKAERAMKARWDALYGRTL